MATHFPCLENLMDNRAWWAAVHGVAKIQTQLSEHAWASTSYKINNRDLPYSAGNYSHILS